jgi:argininosuccinate lyase
LLEELKNIYASVERGEFMIEDGIEDVHSQVDEEALRIVSLMPKWKPGRQAGKNRNVKFAFPVAFKPSVQNTN